jgi:hypothetical protein
MCDIHDVGTSGLSQIVKLADHRLIVEVEIKCRFFLEGMQTQGDLGWNRFGLGVLDPNVFNDGINQGMLCKFIGTILKLLDADSHIIRWMALILNVESQSLNLCDCLSKLGVVVTQEDPVVHTDHEDNVPTKEYTVIN